MPSPGSASWVAGASAETRDAAEQFLRAGGHLNSLSPPAMPSHVNTTPPTEYSVEAMAEWQVGWDFAFLDEWKRQQQHGSEAHYLQEIQTRVEPWQAGFSGGVLAATEAMKNINWASLAEASPSRTVQVFPQSHTSYAQQAWADGYKRGFEEVIRWTMAKRLAKQERDARGGWVNYGLPVLFSVLRTFGLGFWANYLAAVGGFSPSMSGGRITICFRSMNLWWSDGDSSSNIRTVMSVSKGWEGILHHSGLPSGVRVIIDLK